MGIGEKRIRNVTMEVKGIIELWEVKKKQQEKGEYKRSEKKRRGVRDTCFFKGRKRE